MRIKANPDLISDESEVDPTEPFYPEPRVAPRKESKRPKPAPKEPKEPKEPSKPKEPKKPKAPDTSLRLPKPKPSQMLSGSPSKDEIIESLPPELQEVLRAYPDLTDAEALRIATYFSGIGTVEAALPGIKSMLAVEYDPKIVQQHNISHGSAYAPRDVNKVDPAEVKAANSDLFHASPVCKEYSKANNRRPQIDSELSINSAKAIARVIREAQPPAVSIENAYEYRSSTPFRIIQEALNEMGYNHDVVLIDAKDLGAASNRKRMILRAVRGGGALPPLPKARKPGDWWEAIKDLVDDAPDDREPLPYTGWESIKYYIRRGELTRAKPILLAGNEREKLPGGQRPLNPGEPAFALTAAGQAIRIIMPDGRVKRFTPRMMARIMGLPDTFKVPKNYNMAKLVLGNGIHGEVTRQVLMPLMAAGRRAAQGKTAHLRHDLMHRRAGWFESRFDFDRVAQEIQEELLATPGSVETEAFEPMEVPAPAMPEKPSSLRVVGPLSEVDPERRKYLLNPRLPVPEEMKEGLMETPGLGAHTYGTESPAWHIRQLPAGLLYLTDENRSINLQDSVKIVRYRHLSRPCLYSERMTAKSGKRFISEEQLEAEIKAKLDAALTKAERAQESLNRKNPYGKEKAIRNAEAEARTLRASYVLLPEGTLIDMGEKFAESQISAGANLTWSGTTEDLIEHLPSARVATPEQEAQYEQMLDQLVAYPPGTVWNAIEDRPATPEEERGAKDGTLPGPLVDIGSGNQKALMKKFYQTNMHLLSPELFAKIKTSIDADEISKSVPKDVVIDVVKPPSPLGVKHEDLLKEGKFRVIDESLEAGMTEEELRKSTDFNIDGLAVMAIERPDLIEHFGKWYDTAHDYAKQLSSKFGVPVSLVSALLAHMSPNSAWDKNIYAVEQLLKGRGPKIKDYRRMWDEARSENWLHTLFPSLVALPERIGTGQYFENIVKAQRLLDAYLESGGTIYPNADAPPDAPKTEFKIDIDDPVLVEWRPNDPKSVKAAVKLYKKLSARGWLQRTLSAGQMKTLFGAKVAKALEQSTPKPTKIPIPLTPEQVAANQAARARGEKRLPHQVKYKTMSDVAPDIEWAYHQESMQDVIEQREMMDRVLGAMPADHKAFFMIPPMALTDDWTYDAKGAKPSERTVSEYMPKVTSFFRAINDPEGTRYEVVLDGHAINILRGFPKNLKSLKKPTPAVRDVYIKAYIEGAKRVNKMVRAAVSKRRQEQKRKGLPLEPWPPTITPQALQAITWELWRSMIKIKKEKGGENEPLETAQGELNLFKVVPTEAESEEMVPVEAVPGKGAEEPMTREARFSPSWLRQAAALWDEMEKVRTIMW